MSPGRRWNEKKGDEVARRRGRARMTTFFLSRNLIVGTWRLVRYVRTYYLNRAECADVSRVSYVRRDVTPYAERGQSSSVERTWSGGSVEKSRQRARYRHPFVARREKDKRKKREATTRRTARWLA